MYGEHVCAIDSIEPRTIDGGFYAQPVLLIPPVAVVQYSSVVFNQTVTRSKALFRDLLTFGVSSKCAAAVRRCTSGSHH